MPPSVQDWLPKEHLARFVVELVEHLDLRMVRESYAGRGSAAYHPEMLVALLFYGYATGIRASRKLETATYESVPFRFIAANTHPDHDTISDFRMRFLPQLTQIFEQLLVVAHESGFLRVGQVSVDGTKIRASASKHNALSLKRGTELQRRFRREAQRMLELAEQADREDTGDDDFHLPAELARREDRIAAIKAAMERIRARETERIEREKAEREEAKAERARFEEANGRRFETRLSYHRIERNPNAQINLTDEDSRIMPSGEGFVQAYNGQLAVDTKSQLILSAHLTQHPIDVRQLQPALEKLARLPIGKPTALIADGGYYSELNVERCAALGIDPYISRGREKHHWGMRHWHRPKEPAAGASALDLMRYRLRTAEGRAIYAQRKCTVEPVIGNLKRSMGLRQFLLRGFEKVSGEWTLASAAWNIRRLHAMSWA